nr:hypothetical protein GCM10020063_000660 [Dactylosporangium thailandense]
MTEQTRDRAALRARLEARLAAFTAAEPAAEPDDSPQPALPLTGAERAMWLASQLDPDSPAYHVPIVVRLVGPLDRPALLAAVRDVIGRHPALRSTITVDGGTPVAVAAPADAVPVDERAVTPDTLAAALSDHARRPFRLAAEPPLRVTLFAAGTGEHHLALTAHHVAMDDASITLLVAELAERYAGHHAGDGPPAPLRPVRARGRAPEPDEDDLRWWTRRLAGFAPAPLPVGRVTAPGRTPDDAGAQVPLTVPAALADRVRAVAAAHGMTPFMVLLAALQAMLARTGDDPDVAVGVPEAGRREPGSGSAIGCFVNTVVVRTDLSGDLTGRDVLSRVREAALDALSHADVPLPRIVELVNPRRDDGSTPLFRVLLNVVPADPHPATFPGLATTVTVGGTDRVRSDLTVRLSDAGDGPLDGVVEYRLRDCDAAAAHRIAGWLLAQLAGLTSDVDSPIRTVPLPGSVDPAVAGAPVDAPTGTLHPMVTRWAAATPDATAVVAADGTLTYAELDRRANRVARRLLADGVAPDAPVAVLTERSTHLPVALLGILKAGAAYLPVDPTYPPARLAALLRAAGAATVLVADGLDEALADGLADADLPVAVRRLDDPETFTVGPDGDPGVECDPGRLAYVIFTSGSTGTPKGVAVEHRAITRYLAGVADRLPTGAASFALVSTQAADLGLTMLLGALTTGAAAHLVDVATATDAAAFAGYLARHPVDVLKLVPGHLHLLASETGADLADVLPRRLLILAGEACPWELVDRVRAARPDLAVQVHYGPTETTVAVLALDVSTVTDRAGAGVVPLGGPLPGVRCRVADRAGAPLPAGLPGELWLAGPSLARGYLHDDRLTARRFVTESGVRWYRTGDRVRLRADGHLDFLGRTDDQVKIQGYRVEPGEVAAALRRLDGVDAAVVLPVGPPGGRRLVAWFTGAEGGGPDEARLRDELRGRLPRWMVPASIVRLDALPLTPNGKVDRARLPEPVTAVDTGPVSLSPTEEAVAAAWRQVLDGRPGAPATGAIRPDDDFFALGGHSFAATRVAALLRTTTGRDVPARLTFRHPVLRDFAAALDRTAPPANGVAPAAGQRGPGTVVPLSAAQARLWFLASLDPDSPTYHVPMVLRLPAGIDRTALLDAVRLLADRHEVLRSTVTTVDGQPCARIGRAADVPVRERAVPAADLDRVLAAEVAHPFDLQRHPAMRAVLLRVVDGADHLAIVFHHVATDAWSRGLILADLVALYRYRVGTGPLPPPAPQYADHATALRAEPDGPALDWWERQLAGLSRLDLPTDRPPPPTAGGAFAAGTAGAAVPIEVPDALAGRIRALAGSRGMTPFMVLLAGLQALLARVTGASDIAVGVPETGRHGPGTEDVVGCFVNTVVVRGQVDAAATAGHLLDAARAAALAAFAHADVPFDRVVQRLRPDRDAGTGSLFQVSLNVHDAGPTVVEFGPGLPSAVVPVPETEAKFDLSWHVAADGTALRGSLTYRSALFDEPTARRLVSWYLTLLHGLLSTADVELGAIPLAPVDGPALTGPPLPHEDGVLHPLIERWADATPDATAVVAADATLTYAELDRRANRVAHWLLDRGVRADQPVAVLTERTSHLAVALLGVLKAGAAYLPVDAGYPPERVRMVLRGAGAVATLAEREFAGNAEGTVAVLDDATWAGLPTRRPDAGVRPDRLAYVIFTSGSTGAPKGVAVEHRHITHYLAAALAYLGAAPRTSYALVSTQAADLGMTNLFGALTTGAALHLVDRQTATDPEAFAAYQERERVDVLKCVPSHLELLAAHGDLGRVLPRRVLILAGEPLLWDLVDRVRAARPDLTVVNSYGPSETTVAVSMCDVDAVPRTGSTVPLGEPLSDVDFYVTDAAGRPQPAGIPGELRIGGPTVSRGYLGRPDLTAERFPVDPLDPARRCYRSGDLVRLRPDGQLEFRGRADDQVKIRGYRVEPGEIVAVLRRLPGVREAVVLPVGEGHQRRLAAWITGTADVDQVRQRLRQDLPEYAVPTTITGLDALPLTANGKVDRARLPAPAEAAPAAYVEPATATEHRVAAAYAQVLDVERVGATDDFFALGGDSFQAVQAARAADPDLRVIDLFNHPTVRDLAAFLDRRSGEPAGLLHRLGATAGTAEVTVVCVPYGGGSAAAYRPLAMALGPRVATYAIELPGHDPARPDEPLLPLPQLVDRVAAEVAGQFTGPVVVYGHCVGTATAVALAQRLQADGAELAGVVLAAAFPTARLPGRLSAWFNRVLPSDRWMSDRDYRDVLRAMGGMLDDLDDTDLRTMMNSLRHDARQAQLFHTGELARADRTRLSVPVLCVVGERDRSTELYQERYREWGAYADRVELAVVPNAGHYFLKHQATHVAELIGGRLAAWRAGRMPPPVADMAVAGSAARRSLRAFSLVAAGQTASLIGSALSAFALGVWAYQTSGRMADYALITLLAVMPAIVGAPVGGAVADRFDRRRVMLVCDAVAGLTVAALVVLLWLDSLRLWHVAVIVGTGSLVTAFHRPAYLAAITQLVPKPYLPQANAVAQLGTGLGMLLAPLAGGALITAFGLPAVVGIDVLTFVLGLTTLLVVRFPDRLFRRQEETFRQAIAGGWRYIVRRRPLVVMIVFFLVDNYLSSIATVVVTPLVLSIGDAADVGLVTAASGLGAAFGAVVMVVWGGTRRRATGMVGFVLGVGAGILIMGLRPAVLVVSVGIFVWWASTSILNAHWLALIQIKVGLELQGRVLATNQMLAVAMAPAGYVSAPWLADRIAGTGIGPVRGMSLLLVTVGAVLMGWAALGLRYRPLHRMEDDLPDAVAGAKIEGDLDQVQAEADRELASVRS